MESMICRYNMEYSRANKSVLLRGVERGAGGELCWPVSTSNRPGFV